MNQYWLLVGLVAICCGIAGLALRRYRALARLLSDRPLWFVVTDDDIAEAERLLQEVG
jgi:hypothetical protein